MMTNEKQPDKTHDNTKTPNLDPVENQWGNQPDNNFGYASEDERRAHRGLEDWEMLDAMSKPQPGVRTWLRTVIVTVVAGVLLFALTAYAINYLVHHFGPSLLGKG